MTVRCLFGHHRWRIRRIEEQLNHGLPKIAGTYPTRILEQCQRWDCGAQRKRFIWIEPLP
jgi:hypothetical protein